MDNLEYIEAYYTEEPTELRKKEFEDRIQNDPEFARELAFYLSLKSVAGELAEESKRERFRKIYASSNYNTVRQPGIVRRMLPRLVAVAAVVAILVIGWVIWFKPLPPQKLATNYINKNFETLPVTMGSREDSLQMGLKYYNEGELARAQNVFENLLKSDPRSATVKKIAGIVSLRLNHYDKAIEYFTLLAADKELQVNPGKFLHAVTLMKRNRQGDAEAAKILLNQVVDSNQYGAAEAKQWLAKW